MSKTQILEELPWLTVSDRSQRFTRLAELQVTDLLNSNAHTPGERQALNEALAEFENDRNPGKPRHEVIRKIHKPRR
jgi:hypothetical protein